MKSRKFATVIFALGGLMFLSSVGFAVYKDVKPAPASLQLSQEEKKLVEGAMFQFTPYTQDITNHNGATYALLDGEVKRIGFGENPYSYGKRNEMRDFSLLNRPRYGTSITFKGYKLYYGAQFNVYQTNSNPAIGYTLMNTETKEIVSNTVSIPKEIRGDRTYIESPSFYRDGDTLYAAIQWSDAGQAQSKSYLLTFSIDLKTGTPSKVERVDLPEKLQSFHWRTASRERVYDPQRLVMGSSFSKENQFYWMTFDAKTKQFTEIESTETMAFENTSVYVVEDQVYLLSSKAKEKEWNRSQGYEEASERKNNEWNLYKLGANHRLELSQTIETDPYAPLPYLNQGNLVMISLVDGKPTLRVQSLKTKDILLSKPIDVIEKVFFTNADSYRGGDR
ncbi:hypothetical protein [uncultured Granulicatella sp.]|uniref:hypothetical protein n=1 Tax=uncultured Granulicatella sp. TaxID=316089 RepID=UPI00262385E1|nr:hypothetical protein [uncultured Granulicatella sp.]